MSRFKKSVVVFFTICTCFVTLFAQNNQIDVLEKKVTAFNDALQYEKSIQLLSDFITDKKSTSFDRYRGYVYKSYTYKRLFNYAETLHNLNLALEEGLKSNKKAEVINEIKAEKAFVYFDTHDYEKAAVLMDELSKDDYQYLDNEVKSFIIMQEGFLLMRQKKYIEAEQKLNKALAITLKYVPRNAPNIYGKIIELYNAMGLYDKRDDAFKKGLKIAKDFKILKYEMYLYEVMQNQFQKNGDYKGAFYVQKKYDSLSIIYNATNNSGKIQILEKQIDDKQKELELKNEKNIRLFLIGLISILIVLLFISFKLYRSNKEKKELLERENIRIHNQIEMIAKAIDEKGNLTLDITKYNLTERQVEIIQLIKQGKSNKEIANQLFISENTVKYHLKIIYGILDIEHRTKLL